MTTYKIHSGHHRAHPYTLGIWHNKTMIKKMVEFDPSCRYHLDGDDQLDINKLFGIGYFFSHHTDSARFGWRWSVEKGMIELFAYCYINKEMKYHSLGYYDLATRYEMIISVSPGYYLFTIKPESGGPGHYMAHYTEAHGHKKKWAYPLGIYFGGNKTAPHDIFIDMGNL